MSLSHASRCVGDCFRESSYQVIGRQISHWPCPPILRACAQKLYDTKQYKKAVKTADLILKKCPTHGETLAMKGLVLNCQSKKAEAYQCVRDGLKHDLKSHVCWHVYGCVSRGNRTAAHPHPLRCLCPAQP